MDNALQRLENVTMEESRMTGAETLKAIHSVGNKVGDNVHGVQDALQVVNDKVGDVEDMLQAITEMLQGVGNGRQTENHFDTVIEKGLEAVSEKLEAVDHVDKVPGAVKDIGSNSIAGDGVHLFSNRSSTPSPSVLYV